MKSDEIETKQSKKIIRKTKFSFPHEKKVIEASSLAEASELLKKSLK